MVIDRIFNGVDALTIHTSYKEMIRHADGSTQEIDDPERISAIVEHDPNRYVHRADVTEQYKLACELLLIERDVPGSTLNLRNEQMRDVLTMLCSLEVKLKPYLPNQPMRVKKVIAIQNVTALERCWMNLLMNKVKDIREGKGEYKDKPNPDYVETPQDIKEAQDAAKEVMKQRKEALQYIVEGSKEEQAEIRALKRQRAEEESEEKMYMRVIVVRNRLRQLSERPPFEAAIAKVMGHAYCDTSKFVLLTSSTYLPWIFKTMKLTRDPTYILRLDNPEFLPEAARIRTSRHEQSTMTLDDISRIADRGALRRFIDCECSIDNYEMGDRFDSLFIDDDDAPRVATNELYFQEAKKRTELTGEYPRCALLKKPTNVGLNEDEQRIVERMEEDASSCIIRYMTSMQEYGVDPNRASDRAVVRMITTDEKGNYLPPSLQRLTATSASTSATITSSSRYLSLKPTKEALALVKRNQAEAAASINTAMMSARLVESSSVNRIVAPSQPMFIDPPPMEAEEAPAPMVEQDGMDEKHVDPQPKSEPVEENDDDNLPRLSIPPPPKRQRIEATDALMRAPPRVVDLGI
jgi:hypothetical protein